jgi:hypothetical protein
VNRFGVSQRRVAPWRYLLAVTREYALRAMVDSKTGNGFFLCTIGIIGNKKAFHEGHEFSRKTKKIRVSSWVKS